MKHKFRIGDLVYDITTRNILIVVETDFVPFVPVVRKGPKKLKQVKAFYPSRLGTRQRGGVFIVQEIWLELLCRP